jgi:uncharacterized membrane protein
MRDVDRCVILQWHDPRASYWLGGGVLYLIGTVLVTRLFNVPRNDTLAVVSPANSEAANLWVAYLSSWTASIVRT